jgi:hypothetical protein
MCGDLKEGIELAVRPPRDPDGDGARPPFLDELLAVEITPEELAAFTAAEEALHARVSASSMMQLAKAITTLSFRWLAACEQQLAQSGDSVLREAFNVAAWDAAFIAAKLDRALSGRERRDEDSDDHPIQNDWNGSAKVALISIGRSEAAWRILGQAIADDVARSVADALQALRSEVEAAFPHARAFVRPGFDE